MAERYGPASDFLNRPDSRSRPLEPRPSALLLSQRVLDTPEIRAALPAVEAAALAAHCP